MTKHVPYYEPPSKLACAFAGTCLLVMLAIVVVGGVEAVHYIVTHLGDL